MRVSATVSANLRVMAGVSVFEVKEARFGDGFYVGLVGEGRVQNDTLVADLRGSRNGAAIHLEEKMSDPLKLRLGNRYPEFCFLVVELE